MKRPSRLRIPLSTSPRRLKQMSLLLDCPLYVLLAIAIARYDGTQPHLDSGTADSVFFLLSAGATAAVVAGRSMSSVLTGLILTEVPALAGLLFFFVFHQWAGFWILWSLSLAGLILWRPATPPLNHSEKES